MNNKLYNEEWDKVIQWIESIDKENKELKATNERLQRRYDERGDFILSDSKKWASLTDQYLARAELAEKRVVELERENERLSKDILSEWNKEKLRQMEEDRDTWKDRAFASKGL